jgi:hypothetical protein
VNHWQVSCLYLIPTPVKLSSNSNSGESTSNSCGCSSCCRGDDSDWILYNILWNFSHRFHQPENPTPLTRLTLAQNPWFYTGLSDKPAPGYNTMHKNPLNDFETLAPTPRQSSGRDVVPVPVIHVLGNGSGRVFFECSSKEPEKREPRVFDIVWAKDSEDIPVFKGWAIMFVMLP